MLFTILGHFLIDTTKAVNSPSGDFMHESFLRMREREKASIKTVMSILNSGARDPKFDTTFPDMNRSEEMPKIDTKKKAIESAGGNSAEAKKILANQQELVKAAEKRSAAIWDRNLQSFIARLEQCSDDEERLILVKQIWRWATEGFQKFDKGQTPLDVLLMTNGQTRKTIKENERSIFRFRAAVLEVACSVIPREVHETPGHSTLTRGQKTLVTKAHNKLERTGDYRCRKTAGKLDDENTALLRRVRGMSQTFLNQLVIREISSMEKTREFLKDLPDHLLYIGLLDQELLESLAGQFFASQKGARQSAISSGTKFGAPKLRGRSSPALTIVVPAKNTALKIPDGERQELSLRVFRDLKADRLTMTLTSAVPDSYRMHGVVRLVTPCKKSRRLEVHFTVPSMQMESKFKTNVPLTAVAVDLGTRIYGVAGDGEGNIACFGAKERPRLQALLKLDSKLLSAAATLQNTLIQTQRDRKAGVLKHVSAADFQAFKAKCRSQIRKYRRLAAEARMRHRHIIDSLQDQLINYLTRYAVVIMPIFDSHQMARQLRRPYARELMSYRHCNMIEKLQHRCQVTGTILLRGDERFVSLCG